MSNFLRISLLVLFAVISCGVFCIADCPVGDLDGNCSVGIEDLAIMGGQWLDVPGCAGHADDCADIYYPSTPDGVDGLDFALLSSQWGTNLRDVEISEFMATNSYTPSVSSPNIYTPYPERSSAVIK